MDEKYTILTQGTYVLLNLKRIKIYMSQETCVLHNFTDECSIFADWECITIPLLFVTFEN